MLWVVFLSRSRQMTVQYIYHFLPHPSQLIIYYFVQIYAIGLESQLFKASLNEKDVTMLVHFHATVETEKSWAVWRSGRIATCSIKRMIGFGGEVVSLKRRPPFTPMKIPGTHFC
jgi:hypothetical protein